MKIIGKKGLSYFIKTLVIPYDFGGHKQTRGRFSQWRDLSSTIRVGNGLKGGDATFIDQLGLV